MRTIVTACPKPGEWVKTRHGKYLVICDVEPYNHERHPGEIRALTVFGPGTWIDLLTPPTTEPQEHQQATRTVWHEKIPHKALTSAK